MFSFVPNLCQQMQGNGYLALYSGSSDSSCFFRRNTLYPNLVVGALDLSKQLFSCFAFRLEKNSNSFHSHVHISLKFTTLASYFLQQCNPTNGNELAPLEIHPTSRCMPLCFHYSGFGCRNFIGVATAIPDIPFPSFILRHFSGPMAVATFSYIFYYVEHMAHLTLIESRNIALIIFA